MGDVIVVGAGISGSACARVLVDAGHRVTVLDRGRVPGGRMAIRRQQDRPVDIGASYFTVSDPTFQRVVEDWRHRGLARPWTNTFAALGDGGEKSATGPMRWSAPAGLRSLVEDLCRELPVQPGSTAHLVDLVGDGLRVDGRAADAVVLAMPDPQARRLLGAGLATEAASLDAGFDPVLAVTAVWPDRSWPDRNGYFVNNSEVLSWIADDGLRRGDRAPVLVAHSTAGFARGRLDDPESGVPEMITALRSAVGIAAHVVPLDASVHRWTYAKPASTHGTPFLMSDNALGVCGDAWSAKPSVEAAFLSGRALGLALAERLAN